MTSGWQTRPIGEVFRVVNGGTPKTGVPSYWDGPHAWITPAEMGSRETPYVAESRRTLTSAGLSAGAELVPAGSIIVSTRAPIGHLVINEVPMAFNQGCKGLVPLQNIDTKFAYYFLMANVPLLESLGTGATFKELSGGKLKEVPITFPSISEQQRIVAILDEATASITTARLKAEKNLDHLRAAVESHLESVFAHRRHGWEDRRLSTLCREITVGHVGSMAKEYRPDGVPFLRSQNIRPFEVSLANVVFIDEAFHRAISKSRLRPGDVAIVRTGYPGTAAVIPANLPEANCSDLVIMRPGEGVDPHFVAAFFNSAFGKQIVLGKLVGAAQKHFNVTAAKEVVLHLPPVTEQRSIVERIAAVRKQAQCLDKLYRRKLAALDELKQSLLHRAFSGQL